MNVALIPLTVNKFFDKGLVALCPCAPGASPVFNTELSE